VLIRKRWCPYARAREDEVLRNLKPFPEVKEAYMVYGVYDIIARLETETLQDLKEAISRKIRRLEKVLSTLTMIVVEQLLSCARVPP